MIMIVNCHFHVCQVPVHRYLPTVGVVRVFSDFLVAFFILIFATISGKYQNMEKPLLHQKRLGLSWVVIYNVSSVIQVFVFHRISAFVVLIKTQLSCFVYIVYGDYQGVKCLGKPYESQCENAV